MDSSSRGTAAAETLGVFDRTAAPRTPLTTTEVAEELGCTRRAAYDRLAGLADAGEIETKKVGAKARVWWRVADDVGADEGGPGAHEGGPGAHEVGADEPDAHELSDADGALSRLVDNIPGLVYRCRNEPGWPMSFVSDGCRSVTGHDPDDVEGGAVSWGRDVVHPDDRDRVAEAVERGLAEDGEFRVTYRVTTGADETRWVAERGCGVGDGGDGYDVLEGVITDVTEQKRTERALREETSFRESFLDAHRDVVYAFGADGTMRRWNDRVAAVTGYDEVAIEEMGPLDFVAEEARDRAEAAVERVLDGESLTIELPLLTADGDRLPYEFSAAPVRDDEGDVGGFTGVGRDLSDRRDRERRLREERDLLERVFEAVPVSIGVVSTDGEFVRANDRADDRLGTELLDGGTYRVGDRDVYDEDGAFVPVEERPYARALETGESVEDWHCQIDLPEYGRRWLSINAEPLTDAEGEVERVVVCGDDITRVKEQADRFQRERDALSTELDEIYERITEAFLAVDDDWRFTHVNETAESVLDVSEERVLGERLWDVFPEAVDTAFWDRYREAMATQEPVHFDEYYEPLGAWLRVDAYPSESGLSVYFHDVTGEKERERALQRSEQRYRTLAEHFPNGAVGVYDEDLRYDLVEGAMWDGMPHDASDLVGQTIYDVFSTDVVDDVERLFRAAIDEGRTDSTHTEYGGRVLQVWATPLRDADGEIFAGMSFAQDVTERIERERELESARQRYRTLAENFPSGVVGAFDRDLAFTDVEGGIWDDLDADPADLEGERVGDAVSQEAAADLVPLFEGAIEGEVGSVETDIGDRTFRVWALPIQTDDGDLLGGLSLSVDVTERIERERELEWYERIVENLPVGVYRNTPGPDGEFVEMNSRLAEIFDADSVAELSAYDVSDLYPDPKERSEFSEILAERGTVEDYQIEQVTLDGRRIWISVTAVRIEEDGEVFFDGIVQDVTERVERERELRRRRERLEALDDLNAVVRDVTDAVVEQSTREEIERAVCARLADSDQYEFAWTCELDPKTGSIEPRVEAGVDGYARDLDLEADDESDLDPTARAIRDREVHVVGDAVGDAESAAWRDLAETHGFRSSAAVPIEHEDRLYGVLNLYADREDAFDDEEGAVVAHLGEVIGNAVAAAERKRALMSDEVVEVRFRVENVLADVGVSAHDEVDVDLADTVAVGDDEYLVYGTAEAGGFDLVRRICDVVDHWTSVTRLDDPETGEPCRFELHLDGPPIVSLVASHGGYVESAGIAGADYDMTVHLPPSVDVRRIVEAIQDVYADAEMISRRQISRLGSNEDVRTTLTEGLTDRQRAALEASFHSGFFEWPRENSGEEVAESLGVTPPTFHQHLRKAERKVFASVLE